MTHTVAVAGRKARRERVIELMERHHLGAVILDGVANFAWYTGGADSRVDHASPVGVAAIVITPDAELVVTNNIEARRMREEQVPDFEVVEYPWYLDDPQALDKQEIQGPFGYDTTTSQGMDVSEDIARLRHILDPDALERYPAVGADAVSAMAEAQAMLLPGMGEWEASAALSAACRSRGLYCSVVMAAADDRITSYRHPITHRDRIAQHRFMLVLCAERGGLYANLTCFVHFDDVDAEWRARYSACREILERMREATVPGRTLADVFTDCRRFYAEAGHPDEWQLHHQGGMTGYASREVIAGPDTTEVISTGQAFAWNPSITGAKAEDTFVITDSGTRILTDLGRLEDGEYPIV